MKRNKINWLIGILLFLPIAYGMLATVFIRMTSPRVMKKHPARKGITLTFDDGPHPVYTARLLDLLKEHDIQAIFFVVGEKVRAYPDIVRRMKEEGHQIGIHHYEHTSSWLLTPWQLRRQLQDTDAAIKDIIGEQPTLYRPPWGFMNAATLSVSRPYRIIMKNKLYQTQRMGKY
ncbi:polysaccharide deacetylase family protein [Sporosarcina newyorkensis]|nr:polysaccharide deacetylase family protein [Sporosarcina newyorkensis]